MISRNQISRNSALVQAGREELLAVYNTGICTPALTGGIVRDQLHGITPRDIDLAIIDRVVESPIEIIDVLDGLGWMVQKVYNNDDEDGYADRLPGDESRFDYIIKMEKLEADLVTISHLDLLVYAHPIQSINDMIASHDHNVSQFAAWVTPGGDVRADYLGDDSTFGVLTKTREHVTPARLIRVNEIARSLKWLADEDEL